MIQWFKDITEDLIFMYRILTSRDLETGKKEETDEAD